MTPSLHSIGLVESGAAGPAGGPYHRAAGGQAGMFYIDGHVRAYHGRHDLPKARLARMRC